MKTLFTIIFFISLTFVSKGQNIITGTVKDNLGNPLPGASVISKTPSGTIRAATSTTVQGEFSIEALPKDILDITYIGYSSTRILVKSDINKYNIIIKSSEELESLVFQPMTSGSSASSWVGATLFYNLDGSDLDNVVGAAKVRINTAKFSNSVRGLHIISNISKFSGAVDPENLSRDIREISQSSQGLSVGLEPIWHFYKKSDIALNLYGTANYKLNNFQNIDNTDENVALSQGRFALGFEFEGIEFLESGLLHFSVEGAATIFSEERYLKVFKEEKSHIYSFDWTLIVPLFGNLGLLINQNYAQGIKPTFGAGFIVKSQE